MLPSILYVFDIIEFVLVLNKHRTIDQSYCGFTAMPKRPKQLPNFQVCPLSHLRYIVVFSYRSFYMKQDP